MRSIIARILIWFVLSSTLILAVFFAASQFFITAQPSPDVWTQLAYYLWILVAIAVMCVLLVLHFGAPLVQLRKTMERFGQGDHTARTGSTRQDEIGDLSRAFDAIADQIESLLSAERRLLRDVAHELRSPLTRLGFAVELAKTSTDRDGSLARIRKEASRLNDLVEQLLQVNRVEAVGPTKKTSNVSLTLLLTRLVDDCGLEAQARGTTLAAQIDQPLDIRGEPELLRRALENVLRNAVRHSPTGTTVDVSLVPDGEFAVFTVRDYGPGVPEQALNEIFKPFYRVEGDRNRVSGGVGLGLAIAQRAVALHGGTILAENAEPGLRVVIRLPGAITRATPSEPIPAPVADAPGS